MEGEGALRPPKKRNSALSERNGDVCSGAHGSVTWENENTHEIDDGIWSGNCAEIFRREQRKMRVLTEWRWGWERWLWWWFGKSWMMMMMMFASFFPTGRKPGKEVGTGWVTLRVQTSQPVALELGCLQNEPKIWARALNELSLTNNELF